MEAYPERTGTSSCGPANAGARVDPEIIEAHLQNAQPLPAETAWLVWAANNLIDVWDRGDD
jgi:hypothetical protein